MSDDADRFHQRAGECRRLAADARDADTRRQLSRMATELDDEADRIEAEETAAAKPKDA
jgi:hypothetical protein